LFGHRVWKGGRRYRLEEIRAPAIEVALVDRQ
jgi:hypothetical protein